MKSWAFRITIVLVMLVFAGCYSFQRSNRGKIDPEFLEIPQDYRFGYLTIPLTINDKKRFEALLDTGLPFRGLVLFNRESGNEAALEYSDTINIGSAGNEAGIPAFVSPGTKVTLKGDLLGHESTLVMDVSRDDSKFDLDAIVGKLIFDEYLVEMDFDRDVIRLHNHGSYIPDRSWTEIPLISHEDGNAYINIEISIRGEAPRQLLCAIDAGALSHDLKLTESPEIGLNPPANSIESYLGSSLTSDLFGHLFRLDEVRLGNYKLKDVLTTMPHRGTNLGHEGNGSIGLSFLKRFNIIYDYPNGKVYFKPNRYFGDPFLYSMTGYRAKTLDDKSREIVQIYKNSAAQRAGLQKGDILRTLNGKNMLDFTVTERESLYRQEGKRIAITIERDGTVLQKELTLSRIL